jgi:hypothetical protein
MVAVLASEDGLAMQITTSEIGSGTAIGVAILDGATRVGSGAS